MAKPFRVLPVAASVLLASLTVAAPAAARPAASASISKVTFTGATHTSLTVTVSGHASRYKLYVAQVHHQLIADLLPGDPSSPWSKSKTLTVTGLKYSTTPYFFRVVAESGSRHAYSNTYGPVGLKPSAPTGLTVTNPYGAVSLDWSDGVGTGYVVERAGNSAFTADKHTYQLIGLDQQLTPGDLSKGSIYYFRVRAVNTGTKSAPSNVVTASAPSDRSPVTAMTYNLHEADIAAPQGESWSDRRNKVASLIAAEHPSVVAVQEAAAWIGAVKGPRQVDDLVSALGGVYQLARTEIPPNEPHYFRTADYVLYDPNVLHPIGNGDHWDLGHASAGANHWAAYQKFQVIATGAKFIFVSFHLHVQNNDPASDDQIRQDQTESMLAQGSAYAASSGLPIVYAGDTNSVVEAKHKFDGPRIAMQAEHIADAFAVAQSRSGTKYDTANNFQATPPAHHKYIDGVFAPGGIAMTTWRQVLNLSGGQFVGTIPSDHNPVVVTLVVPY